MADDVLHAQQAGVKNGGVTYVLLRGNPLLSIGCAVLSACMIADEKKDSIHIIDAVSTAHDFPGSALNLPGDRNAPSANRDGLGKCQNSKTHNKAD